MTEKEDKSFELFNGLVAIVHVVIAHLPESKRTAVLENLRSFLREMSEAERKSGSGFIIEKFVSAMESRSPAPPKVLH